MVQNKAIIKWSNSFPGIIAIVYPECPTMVCLYDSSHLDKPGKFHEMDPNREHGSLQYFNDSVVCMDWGYGMYDNHLALGLSNGDVIVRLCSGGIFTKGEVCSRMHNTQSLRCISLSWRRSMDHIAIGLLRDEKTYCIDIYDVMNHSLVIPTINSNRVLQSIHWIDRKGQDSSHNLPKHSYMGLVSPRDRVEDASDLLLAGYENYIQVIHILSSTHQVLYNIDISYKCITTFNSRVALINDNSPPPVGIVPNFSASPELGPSSLQHQSQSYRHIHAEVDYDTKTPLHGPRTMSMDYRDPNYPVKKKETVVESSLPLSQHSDGLVNVYDVNATGKLEFATSFYQDAGPVIWSSWYSKQELFIADAYCYFIIDVATGKAFCKPFPVPKVIGCAIDIMEHPIITRIVSFMTVDQTVSWSYLSQVVYRSYSFANHHKLCISEDPHHFRWIDLHHLPESSALPNPKKASVASTSSEPSNASTATNVTNVTNIPNIPNVSNMAPISNISSFSNLSTVSESAGAPPANPPPQPTVPLVPTTPLKIWDIGDIMISRCQLRYSTDIAKNIEIFGSQYAYDHSLSITDLFYFWNSLHVLNLLDEEDLAKAAESNVSKLRLESGWTKLGLLEVFKSWTSGYREERCGRIRAFVSEARERVFQKLLESAAVFEGRHPPSCFEKVLRLVVQCKFADAIQFIQDLLNSATEHALLQPFQMDRLVALCNILTAVLSIKSDSSVLISTIRVQLRYFSKEVSPIVFKTLRFLLMYLECDSDVNSLRARENNDELIRQYLKETKIGPILEVHDLMVVLRYFSSPALLEYLKAFAVDCVNKGLLFGIPIIGMESLAIKNLLQAYVNRTGDVQTPTILALLQGSVYNISMRWIGSYLEILERNELFNDRCELENQFRSQYGEDVNDVEEQTEKFIPGVIVCQNCHAKVIPRSHTVSKGHTAGMPVCRVCQRPLFTCSLCAMPVYPNNANWLVWCYACHHGGHYSHITNWFKTHKECPVNGCTCHCCDI